MAFFFDIIRPIRPSKGTTRHYTELDMRTACEADALELQLRELAFYTCVNLVANTLSLCKVKQFEHKKEIEGRESWLWNVEPNKQQNAAQFWAKLVTKLYMDGDAAIVDEPYGQGVVVADDFDIDDSKSSRVFRGVVCGSKTYDRLTEAHVMYIRLSYIKTEPLIRKMQECFLRLMATAQAHYQYNNAQHWKVHVNQTVTADDEWAKHFQQMLEKQIRPFLEQPNKILPEVDGYDYKQISGGPTTVTSQEVRELYKTIWAETARAMMIPAVLLDGTIADSSKATERLLTDVIDPIAQQITQEANRKRYGYEAYSRGDYVLMDTSTISHYDLLANAANVEKLVGAGLWSVNEIRTKLGDTPIDEEWADAHYLTKNIGSVAETNEGDDK